MFHIHYQFSISARWINDSDNHVDILTMLANRWIHGFRETFKGTEGGPLCSTGEALLKIMVNCFIPNRGPFGVIGTGCCCSGREGRRHLSCAVTIIPVLWLPDCDFDKMLTTDFLVVQEKRRCATGAYRNTATPSDVNLWFCKLCFTMARTDWFSYMTESARYHLITYISYAVML